MSHHGNFRLNQPADERRPLPSSLDLHRFGSSLLEVAEAGGDGLFLAHVIGPERKVRHQQRPPHSAAHGAQMVKHFIQSYRQGGLIAEHYLREGIANQNHIDAGGIHETGGGKIVGGKAGDFFAAQLALQDEWDGDLAHGLLNGVHGGPPKRLGYGRNPQAPIESAVSVCRSRSKRQKILRSLYRLAQPMEQFLKIEVVLDEIDSGSFNYQQVRLTVVEEKVIVGLNDGLKIFV